MITQAIPMMLTTTVSSISFGGVSKAEE